MQANVFDLVRTQIDYYFSGANLVKDVFMRAKMDENGWVPLTVRSYPFFAPHPPDHPTPHVVGGAARMSSPQFLARNKASKCPA